MDKTNKNDHWTFQRRQLAWQLYLDGRGWQVIAETVGKTIKMCKDETWKITVQYYRGNLEFDAAAEQAKVAGRLRKGPLTKREAKVIRLALAWQTPVPIPRIAELLGRSIEEVERFAFPGRHRPSLFGGK